MSDTKTIILRSCSLTVDKNGLPKVSEAGARDPICLIPEGTKATVVEKLPGGEWFIRFEVEGETMQGRCDKNKEFGSKAAAAYLEGLKGQRTGGGKKETLREAMARCMAEGVKR